jgi:hypothetical protein
MSEVFSNQLKSQALKGEGVLVTVHPSKLASLQNIAKGQLATITNGPTGLVHSVDKKGITFNVSPIQPDKFFGVYGFLVYGAVVTVTT